MKSAFAIYRLPHASHCTQITQTEGDPVELQSCLELNGRTGFVLAPFEIKAGQPILLIRPDRIDEIPLSAVPKPAEGMSRRGVADRQDYAIDFANYHAQLRMGAFSKIVLARCVEETLTCPILPIDLFFRACQSYPRMFISLVYTPCSGYWLSATPEILLDGDGQQWRTIALAGTMKLEESLLDGEGQSVSWSIKNIQEQRIVATYIAECLEQFTGDFHEEGPRTVRAANLVHLRSDFTFTLSDHDHLGDLLHALHPTPAVCGIPKREAFRFITQNEHAPRRYYSGFMGPLNVSDTQSQVPAVTHLYVTLRCMSIEGTRCQLYAGGGLLKDSTEEQEWQETEAKLETMRTLLYYV